MIQQQQTPEEQSKDDRRKATTTHLVISAAILRYRASCRTITGIAVMHFLYACNTAEAVYPPVVQFHPFRAPSYKQHMFYAVVLARLLALGFCQPYQAMAHAGDAANSTNDPSVLVVWDFDWYVMCWLYTLVTGGCLCCTLHLRCIYTSKVLLL